MSHFTSVMFVAIVIAFLWFVIFWQGTSQMTPGGTPAVANRPSLTLEEKLAVLQRLDELRNQTYIPAKFPAICLNH